MATPWRVPSEEQLAVARAGTWGPVHAERMALGPCPSGPWTWDSPLASEVPAPKRRRQSSKPKPSAFQPVYSRSETTSAFVPRPGPLVPRPPVPRPPDLRPPLSPAGAFFLGCCPACVSPAPACFAPFQAVVPVLPPYWGPRPCPPFLPFLPFPGPSLVVAPPLQYTQPAGLLESQMFRPVAPAPATPSYSSSIPPN
ncbi:vegetative cell wall protein gp1-like [Heterocephalus glaber]|uniref:Vegetative cell wall protein gp1-like n=1 Tax=Heterocephalus glaber TaxID=10181 RepID=A0AAX6Q4Y4_HETGA|nr:vegetative cell wall protein gp1-like [Heterocephalus glaber]